MVVNEFMNVIKNAQVHTWKLCGSNTFDFYWTFITMYKLRCSKFLVAQQLYKPICLSFCLSVCNRQVQTKKLILKR